MQAKGLAGNGHDVLVATCYGNIGLTRTELDGFSVRSFAGARIERGTMVGHLSWVCAQFMMLFYLLLVVCAGKFDSVVFYGAAPLFAICALVGRVMRRHTCFVEGDLTKSAIRFLSSVVLARSVSLVIVGGSSVLERHFRKIAPKTKCLRLFPPTDTGYFGSGNAVRARERLGVGDSQLLVYTGAITTLEGVDVLIESMPSVLGEYPSVKLIVAGQVGVHDPVLGDSLDYGKVIADLGLSDSVFLAGRLPMQAVADLLAAATILINPKIDHPLNRVAAPIKVGEYLAAGKPVVSTRVCELDEWLVDRQDVLFCEPGAAPELAGAICLILGEPELAERLSRNGAKASQRMCDHQLWGQRVADAIKRQIR
jgi:glycosyltransferase involved in cell wall biosynthesis